MANLIHCESLALKGDFVIKKEDQIEDKSPFSPEAHAKALEFLRSMTPEELMDFMEYRTPGVEETDRTGHFPINPPRPVLTSAKERQKKTA